MAEITKEEHRKRKGTILKAHPWFGSDQLKHILKNDYDFYIDQENAMFYVYPKERKKLKKVI